MCELQTKVCDPQDHMQFDVSAHQVYKLTFNFTYLLIGEQITVDGNSLQDKQWTPTGAIVPWFLKKKKHSREIGQCTRSEASLYVMDVDVTNTKEMIDC